MTVCGRWHGRQLCMLLWLSNSRKYIAKCSHRTWRMLARIWKCNQYCLDVSSIDQHQFWPYPSHHYYILVPRSWQVKNDVKHFFTHFTSVNAAKAKGILPYIWSWSGLIILAKLHMQQLTAAMPSMPWRAYITSSINSVHLNGQQFPSLWLGSKPLWTLTDSTPLWMRLTQCTQRRKCIGRGNNK